MQACVSSGTSHVDISGEFTKGDLFQLIWNGGGFEQQGPLLDSPYNLQWMAEMQNDVLVHRNKLGAIT